MFRKILSAGLAVICLFSAAFAAGQDEEIARLEARIAELEQENQELRAMLSGEETVRVVAARFNGGVVTVEEAKAEYDYRAYFYEMLDTDVSEYEDIIKEEVLESLTEDAILKMKAQEMGVYEPTEEEAQAIQDQAQESLENMIAYYMPYLADPEKTDEENRETVIAYLETEDTTIESLTESIGAQAWRERLMRAACADYVVSDEALKSYYETACQTAELTYAADISAYENDRMNGEPVLWNPEGVRTIKRLLIGFDEAGAQRYQELAAAMESASGEVEIQALMAELDALYAGLDSIVEEVRTRIDAGDDFNLLIDEYGVDEHMRTDAGQDGYFVSAGSALLDEEFVTTAMALEEIGAVSEPVRCDDGVYILRYESDVTPGAVPYETFLADADMRARIEESAREEHWYEIIERWVEEADVEYYPENF